jgi:hypothetical protein
MADVTTAVLAVLVFVLTQGFLMLVLEPVREQRRLIGEVANALLFYANVMPMESMEWGGQVYTVGAERDELEEARKALRELAGRLRGSLWSIPFYDLLALTGFVPKLADVLEASNQLVGWSNSLGRGRDKDRARHRKEIAERLGIAARIEII